VNGVDAFPPLPASIAIREVGPRDGLQPEAAVPVATRVEMITALIAAGASIIEVAAFVSPKAVPAMAGAAEVVAALRRSAAVAESLSSPT